MTRATGNAHQRASTLARHQMRAPRYAAILRQYVGTELAISTAVLATVDGIEISALHGGTDYRPAQLAAMASSLLAVAGAAGREVGHAACARLIVESASGTLLVKPIPAAALVLCLALPPETLLGKALWATDEIAKAVAAE